MTYPIGIDLGTSNSVVAVWQRGTAVVIQVDGRTTLPSAISVLPNGNVLVGLTAKARAQIEPASSVMSVKRFIGDGKTEWKIGGSTYTPIKVSSLVLGRLKKAAEEYLGQPVTEAVVTVPAYFSHAQKRDTKLAAEAKAVGLKVLQLLPEPTAAAVHYGLDQGKDQMLLVYDLGGGTFDVSILQVKDNKFDVVGVDGDFHLGGDDFDMLLVDYLISLIEDRTKTKLDFFRALCSSKKKEKKRDKDPSREMLLARQLLKEKAEAAKIELSEGSIAHVYLPNIMGTSLDEEITIDKYNSLISPMVERTITKIHDVLASTRLTTEDIDRVILVGGSTRNRLVKERVAEAVKEPWTSGRVDEIVAQGAAIVAGSLLTPEEDIRPEIEFHNVTPFSLGVCSYERDSSSCVNSIIIHKNRPVPCVETRPYELQTRVGQDNSLDVYMLQGEERDPAECIVVGKYIFSGVSHQPGGLGKVEIQYGYDRDGIITVAARDLVANRELSMHVEELPEDMTWLDELKRQNRFDPSSLKLLATPAGYDNVGSVLGSLGLPFNVYNAGQKNLDCDIFFWNCLANTHPETLIIKNYVSKGGCLYASCCAADKLQGVFPGIIDFERTGCRTETISADILDAELVRTLGKRIDIHYNAAACYTITTLGEGGTVLLRETRSGKDVMVMVPFEKGHIFYTCFHHHSAMSKKEMQLLELLVMKQISVVSGIPIEVVSDEIGS